MPHQWWIQDVPEGGGANSQSACANLIFFFAENCMTMTEFGPGGVTDAHVDPPMLSAVSKANSYAKTNHVTTYLTSSTAEPQFVI